MLLESIRIAVSYWGRRLEWTYEGRNERHTHWIRVLVPRVNDTEDGGGAKSRNVAGPVGRRDLRMGFTVPSDFV